MDKSGMLLHISNSSMEEMVMEMSNVQCHTLLYINMRWGTCDTDLKNILLKIIQ